MTTQLMEDQQYGTLPVIAGLTVLGGLAWTGLAIAGFAGMLPPIPEQGLGTVPLLGVMSPLGIVLGPLGVASGLGMWQRQSWGRGLFMVVGYFSLIATGCRTFSYLNPQSTAVLSTKIIVAIIAVLLLIGLNWVQNHGEEFT